LDRRIDARRRADCYGPPCFFLSDQSLARRCNITKLLRLLQPGEPVQQIRQSQVGVFDFRCAAKMADRAHWSSAPISSMTVVSAPISGARS
jgi:hypothetical protein